MDVISRWFWSWWPLVWKATHLANDEAHERKKIAIHDAWAEDTDRKKALHAAEIKRLNEVHRTELEDQARAIDAIVKRASEINWDHERGDIYRMTLEFDARLISHGRFSPFEIGLLAERFGRDVEYEIRRGKFIASAREGRQYGRV
jgi:hypothetical protein